MDFCSKLHREVVFTPYRYHYLQFHSKIPKGDFRNNRFAKYFIRVYTIKIDKNEDNPQSGEIISMMPGGEGVKRGGLHYGWAILVIGILVVCCALGLGRLAFGMILPSMQPGLGLSHDQTGFMASANMFGYFISALGVGFLASRFSPRKIVVAGLLWIGLTMVATGLVNDFYSATVARFLTGVGSAGANIAMIGLAAAWFTTRRRGMAMGFLVGGSGLAIAITGWSVPLIDSIFLEAGWRYNWFALGAFVIIIAAISWFVVRNHPSEKGLGPIGVEGSLANGGNFQAVGRAEGAQREAKVKAPGIADVIKMKGVFPLAALYFCFGFSYIIAATYLVTFMVEELGCAQGLAGHIWSTVGIISIGSGLMWGMLSDRLGRRSMLVAVFSIQTGCYLLLQAGFSGALFLWLPAILYGLTAWSVPGLVASCCGDMSNDGHAPAVLGFVTFVFGLGQVLGPALAGFVKEITGSFTGAFALAAGVAFLGILFSSRLVISNARQESGIREAHVNLSRNL